MAGQDYSGIARRAAPDDWERVRDLRLRALRDEPDAFHARYEDEAEEPDEEWWNWIERAPIFVAGDYEGICGAFVRDDGDAQLIAMYVLPEARGRGHGRALVAAVEEWAGGEGIERVTLYVMEPNAHARRLYESCGYEPTGERREDDPRSVLFARTL